MQYRNQLNDSYQDVDVIAIDEAQFFPDLLSFCSTAADYDNKHVIIAGLDGDFKRQRFGQVGNGLLAKSLRRAPLPVKPSLVLY